MALQTVDIDEIVRQVVAELTAIRPAVPSVSAAGGEIQILGHVVTTSQLAGICRGTTIRVAENAVITPAARDLARDRNLRVESSRDDGANGAIAAALYLSTNQIAYDTETLIRLLQRDGIRMQHVENKCVIKAVGESIEYVADNQCRAVVLTTKVAIAACLANRTAGIRALAASSIAQLQGAITEFAPNMLVVNPAGTGVAALKAMVSCFCQSTTMQPEEGYRAVIGEQ